MALASYYYSGLRVSSEIALPEWQAFETDSAESGVDVTIRLDPAQETADAAPLQAPQDYSFLIPEVAWYRVREGRLVEITPLPGAGEREIRLFLLGSAWGALCYQRGTLALHASVLHLNGQTFAFSGPSGSGKSTLAASLVQRGALLVSDDLCSIELHEKEAHVHPSTPRLKLWRSALENLGVEQAGLVQDHFRIDKFHLSPPVTESINEPLRLDGIYLLAWGEPSLRRLRGLPAVQKLVSAATYHPELLTPLNCMGAHWERCMRLATLVPIHEWIRPQDWSEITWPPESGKA